MNKELSWGKCLRSKILRRPKRRREYTIQIDLRIIGCENGRLMELIQDRV
jgi:hypothetical protein